MLTNDVQTTVNELLPLIRQFAASEYGIAVGGAHAKGVADSESDLDIYLFAPAIKSNAERTALVSGFSDDITDIKIWGVEDPFEHAGSDFYYKGIKIENWLRNSSYIENTIDDCQNGVVRQYLVTWTTTGFFNHCCLSDLKNMIPVEDPYGLLAKWQQGLSTYPEKLRSEIINRHLASAKFWPFNFHYTSAIQRKDIIYTTGIVQQVVHNLIQVVFALNWTYFPGDKKLANALNHLPVLPDNFTQRVEELLFPASEPTVELLSNQQKILQELVGEVESFCI